MTGGRPMEKHERPVGNTARAWFPVALWAGVIFYFSTEAGSFSNTAGLLGVVVSLLFPDFTAAHLAAGHLLVRKIGHWCEYFILSLLALRALRTGSPPGRERTQSWIALALVVIYAISDELHQSVVPGRTASLGDVAIDAFGGACGVLWRKLSRRRSSAAQTFFKKS
jgi:VanZ family protein